MSWVGNDFLSRDSSLEIVSPSAVRPMDTAHMDKRIQHNFQMYSVGSCSQMALDSRVQSAVGNKWLADTSFHLTRAQENYCLREPSGDFTRRKKNAARSRYGKRIAIAACIFLSHGEVFLLSGVMNLMSPTVIATKPWVAMERSVRPCAMSAANRTYLPR